MASVAADEARRIRRPISRRRIVLVDSAGHGSAISPARRSQFELPGLFPAFRSSTADGFRVPGLRSRCHCMRALDSAAFRSLRAARPGFFGDSRWPAEHTRDLFAADDPPRPACLTRVAQPAPSTRRRRILGDQHSGRRISRGHLGRSGSRSAPEDCCASRASRTPMASATAPPTRRIDLIEDQASARCRLSPPATTLSARMTRASSPPDATFINGAGARTRVGPPS